jgi:hypothetical protein
LITLGDSEKRSHNLEVALQEFSKAARRQKHRDFGDADWQSHCTSPRCVAHHQNEAAIVADRISF